MNQLNVLSFQLTSPPYAPHSLDWGQTEAFTILQIQSHLIPGSTTLRHAVLLPLIKTLLCPC